MAQPRRQGFRVLGILFFFVLVYAFLVVLEKAVQVFRLIFGQ